MNYEDSKPSRIRRPETVTYLRNEPSKSGRGDWIRTSDPLRPRQVRYQAALRPDSANPPFYRGFAEP